LGTALFIPHTKLSLFILLFFFSNLAAADEFTGRVIGVSDGDTLTVLDSSNTAHKVRLAAIDAPEKSQPFGNRSKQALSDLCFGKLAIVTVIDTDRYRRTVGDVSCSGANANEAMLRSGMAWVYRKYAKGYGRFYSIEERAKALKLGLWLDTNPVPPWEWRKMDR